MAPCHTNALLQQTTKQYLSDYQNPYACSWVIQEKGSLSLTCIRYCLLMGEAFRERGWDEKDCSDLVCTLDKSKCFNQFNPLDFLTLHDVPYSLSEKSCFFLMHEVQVFRHDEMHMISHARDLVNLPTWIPNRLRSTSCLGT